VETQAKPDFQAVWVPPEIPSKWEVIPIHNSDRGAFKRCRRYWDWSSPTRHNLTVKAEIHGINLPMFFGTGIHYALEQYYQPGLRHDPVEAFKTWFNVMWRGGTITEEWLDKVYDLRPKRINIGVNPLWQVRGLEDIMPDPDHFEWDEMYELGINMLKYYKEYSAKNDDFTVIVAEHDFSVPIWDYENDRILKAYDRREESPNFGRMLEVHARGRMDGIWVKPNGKHGIIDHKTAQKWGEDELVKLESDEQTTSYLYCAEVEASYYDLPHKGEPLEEVIYNVLRKAYPRPPTEVASGWFSTNRQTESTTYEMLQDWIAKNVPGVPLNEKQKAYVEYLRECGDENFIIRKFVRRNRHQLVNAGQRMYLETLDMLSPELRVYPNISNSFKCLSCAFRPPCMAKEDGADWEQLLSDNYVQARDR
jgi:PD-(D/E)XK nuclease superfamily